MVWAIFNEPMFNAVGELTAAKSDRVVAIIGGAVVEEALLQAIELRMRKSSVTKLLFKPTGALGGFWIKIELGYILQMYDKELRRTLLGISEIRNLFAHQMVMARFSDKDKP